MSKLYKNKKELLHATILKDDTALDVGFWGQGIQIDDPNWVHNILKSITHNVFGVDLDYDEARLNDPSHYRKSSAEDFNFNVTFDSIFAGDIIEHLSNPGLFLDSCKRNLKDSGKLILTTPNCFNLFNIAEKLRKNEPTVNSDHTCYFNSKTLSKLLDKNGWSVSEVSYLHSLEVSYKESWRKIFLNVIYWLLSRVTHKFSVDLVVIARKQ